MPLLAVAAWIGALVGLMAPPGVVVAVAVLAPGCLLLARRRRAGLGWGWPVAVLVATGIAAIAALHTAALTQGPVADLAREGAVVDARLTVTSDPRPARSTYADLVVVRARVDRVEGRGRAHSVSTAVVVLGDEAWEDVPLGTTVEVSGRLAPADGDAAALLSPSGDPTIAAGPDVWWRAAATVRAAIREAVAPRSPDAAALVPALVVGDDVTLDPTLADDFRVTGLTHLLAVSGTNLTLLVGALLVAGRWIGVRGRWMQVIAAVGIVGFVLLARTEPSVVRAAAMGTVALIALGSNGRERGSRCLGVAVVALLLLDPELARSAGFALSVLATGGILLLAPHWRDAMRWAPRWVAEALSVPLAAQVACTPVVTALSGQVSLVAVAANLLAAPAVAPVTVLGLAGGVVGLVWMPLGQVVAAPGAWAAGWIVAVARHGAALPTAAVGWGTDAWALMAITVLSLTTLWWMPRLLRHPVVAVGCCVLLAVVVASRPPTPGWPAHDWLVAVCDVGQGDALALRAGPASAVVVDAGPDPVLVDRCLDRLGVEAVPLLVLSHFHDDHVAGVAGVVSERQVGEVWVSPLPEPDSGVDTVHETTTTHDLLPVVPTTGVTQQVGAVTLTPVWPPPGTAPAEAGTTDGESSAANDASLVILAEVEGVRILLTGDIEPTAQAGLARVVAGMTVDVLKVPHHGSSRQDLDFLAGLRARLALVSVGRDNDYGHPAASALDALAQAGAVPRRTDLEGDLLVVLRDGELAVAARGG